MADAMESIKIEILANGWYRGKMTYYPPHLPLTLRDLDDIMDFVFRKRPTLKYEKDVHIFID